MDLQSGNVENCICCGDKDAADTGRPKSCRGVPAGQCAGAAAGTPLQHHTSVPHRGTCYFSRYICHNQTHFYRCLRYIPAGEQVRQIGSNFTKHPHPKNGSNSTCRERRCGCSWRLLVDLPSVRTRRCLRQHTGRRIRCISLAARSGMARPCPRASSPSPPRRLCPLPD